MHLRSPIIYFGGKGKMVRKLLKHVPERRIYVEPFGGGASLLFAKDPSPVAVYNDLDSGLVNFFGVLRDSEKFGRFYRLVVLTPYSREEYHHNRDQWRKEADDVIRAYRWYVSVRQSFAGCNGWGYIRRTSNRGMAASASNWLSILEILPAIHERMMKVQIEHLDFRKIIPKYNTNETFWYLDPPYVQSTRRNKKYRHEMNDQDHVDLIALLRNVKGKALLSGYANSIYDPLEKSGWERIDHKTACYAVGRTAGTGVLGKGSALEKQPRVESLWKNY